MIRLTNQLCKDLDSLKQDARFQRYIVHMEESLAEIRENGDVLDGNDLYRNQGKSIILQSQLNDIRDTEKSLTRMSKSQGDG